MEGRERILKLLQENVITIDEANTLIQALDHKDSEKNKKERKVISDTKTKEKLSETIADLEKKLNKIGNEVGVFVKGSLKVVEEKLDELFQKETDNKNDS